MWLERTNGSPDRSGEIVRDEFPEATYLPLPENLHFARGSNAGIEVAYCLVTDGDAGGAETGVARADMALLRRDEQRAAAAIVGVHDLHFLAHPDGRVEATLELRRDVTRVIRTVRPDRVMTQSPDRNWDRIYASHPDHLAAGEATVSAVYPDARNRWARAGEIALAAPSSGGRLALVVLTGRQVPTVCQPPPRREA